MKNPNYWVKEHVRATNRELGISLVSYRQTLKVDCMSEDAADDIECAHEARAKVGYQGSVWDITKIKRVCSTVCYFEVERVPPVKGASFNVAFNLD